MAPPGVSGLELVAAKQLGDTAAHGRPLSPVYATMRDLAKGERLLQRLGGRCPDTLEMLQLDVTDPRSLAAAARRVQGQRLDVLGTAPPGAPAVPGVAGGPLQGHQPSLGLPTATLAADPTSREVPAVLGLGRDVFCGAGSWVWWC